MVRCAGERSLQLSVGEVVEEEEERVKDEGGSAVSENVPRGSGADSRKQKEKQTSFGRHYFLLLSRTQAYRDSDQPPPLQIGERGGKRKDDQAARYRLYTPALWRNALHFRGKIAGEPRERVVLPRKRAAGARRAWRTS